MSKRRKKNNENWLILAIIILMAIIIFFIHLGNVKIEEKTNTSNRIDFKKVPGDINFYLDQLYNKLVEIRKKESQLKRRVNNQVKIIKIFALILFVGFHVSIAYYYHGFDLNRFVQWNEAFLLIILFILFMISERYSNIHNGFSALKKWINQRVFEKTEVNLEEKESLIQQIRFIEAILEAHPGFFKKNRKTKSRPFYL
jgi:hypothetical protein